MKRPLLAMVAGLMACATIPVAHGIPNFAEVEPGVIYRGGQPTAEGWAWLAAHGVTTSVKLNYEPEGAPPSITVVTASMPPEDWMSAEARPSNDAIWDALAALESGPITAPDLRMEPPSPSHAVFVHCDHGQDRTGLIVALYRVRRGWSRSAAWREALAHGFHVIFLGLDDVWEDFPSGGIRP